jgi:hypothetical protein
MDIVLAILPWKIVWKVAINKREKFGALVAMSMGVLYASLPWGVPLRSPHPLTHASAVQFRYPRLHEDHLPQGHLRQQL